MERTKKILALLFLMFSASVFAQNNTELNIENYTYKLYNEQKWDSLATVGSKAIKNGTNYYYLSYRVGYAYFMLEKYRKAIEFFESALSFNSEDSYSLGYLYLCYSYSGRKEEAMLLEKKLSVEQKAFFKIKTITNISFDYGSVLSNNYSAHGYDPLLTGKYDAFGLKDLTSNYNYSGFGLQHKLLKKVIINHSFSMLNINKFREYNYFDIVADSVGLPPENTFKYKTLHYKLNQMDYYFGASIPFKNGIIISPAFHLIKCTYTNLLATNVFKSVNVVMPLPQTVSTFNFTEKDTLFYNFAYSLSLTKNFKAFSITPSLNYSTLNGNQQKGGALSISLFPKSNLNLYSTTTLSVSMDTTATRIFVNQLIGFKLTSKLWAEVHGAYGDMSNGMENNGYLVYNSTDKTEFRGGLNLIYSFKHIELSFRYQFIQKQNTYNISSVNPQNYSSITNTTRNTTYNNNTLIGGIKWNF
ncbi:MAG: tetratricopeptide repeat protein [Bacteroidota bacterium]